MVFRKRLALGQVDGLCLVAITLVSALTYLSGLGFYSDDWSFLAHFKANIGAAPFDFVTVGLYVPALARPLQGIYLAFLFKCFGLWPLPYHIVNTAMLATCAVLLWKFLTGLTNDRRVSFAVAVTFALLPQLSTARVWFAAFQIPLSLMCFLIAAIYELRWARGGGVGAKLVSLLAAAGSLGFYELFAPLLMALAIGSTVIRGQRAGADRVSEWILAALPQIPNAGLVLLGVILKGYVSERAPRLTIQFFRNLVGWMIYPAHDWRIHSGLNIKSILIVHFWDTLVLPFRSTIRVMAAGEFAGTLLAALAIGVIVYWRLDHDPAPIPTRRYAARLFIAGAITFCLGYATFLLSSAVAMSPAGIANRTAVAGALGVAAILVSAAILAASFVAPRLRRRSFAAGMAVMAIFACIRMADVGHHWDAAAAAQARILGDARNDLAAVNADSTIVLDGICPYIGPGIVFETSWDVAGALTLTLGKTVSGDVVTSRLSWDQSGLQTSIYGAAIAYPYGPTLLMYNPVRHSVTPLATAEEARRYFARTDRFAVPCGESFVAHGEPM